MKSPIKPKYAPYYRGRTSHYLGRSIPVDAIVNLTGMTTTHSFGSVWFCGCSGMFVQYYHIKEVNF